MPEAQGNQDMAIKIKLMVQAHYEGVLDMMMPHEVREVPDLVQADELQTIIGRTVEQVMQSMRVRGIHSTDPKLSYRLTFRKQEG